MHILVVTMTIRMKRLPRQHRVAHLRALIRQEPVDSIRREKLTALLRDEVTARPTRDNRTDFGKRTA